MISADKLLEGSGATTDVALKPADPKTCNEWLKAELAAYKDDWHLSLTELAHELGRSATQVSKYLSGKPEGDVAKMELVIDDVLRNAMKRRAIKAQLHENAVSRSVNAALETIRKRNDVGLLKGPSGVGKTSGCALYHLHNPTSILITATGWHKTPKGVAILLWSELRPTKFDNWGRTRMDYLVDKLKGSNRLLIVDQCHRLNLAALDLLFDLHDATDVPIALVGNEQILKLIARSEQNYTRVGYTKPITLRAAEDVLELANIVLEQYAPEAATELLKLALKVVENTGHGRALRKQLLLAADIRDNQRKPMGWIQAFLAAHTRLIRDHTLEVR